jgi:hypothetical protein
MGKPHATLIATESMFMYVFLCPSERTPNEKQLTTCIFSLWNEIRWKNPNPYRREVGSVVGKKLATTN